MLEAVLHRTAERVTSYIKQYVTLAGAENKEAVLGLFDNMPQVFPHWVIMTCPIMHPDINYISKNCLDIFGHSHEYLTLNRSMENIFFHVRDADKEDLYSCFTFMHNFLEGIPSVLHNQYRSIFHYRFRKQNGQYMYLHDEKAVLNLHGSGNLYYGLYRDVTAEKNFTGVKIEIFEKQQSLIKIAEYKPLADRHILTKREGELVHLFRQDLSTKEIAWHLNISHNTVRNIKSKLFEKYNVNNTIELLNLTA